MMKRMAMRVSLLAPQKASTTYSFLLHSSPTAKSLTVFQTCSDMGWLSFLYASEVHHTVSLEFSSTTIYLSLGERPV